MQPLTDKTPKSLLPIAGKPALVYTLEALPQDITSITIAIKYLGEQIKHRFKKKWGKIPISYFNLTSLRGTMDAVRQAKRYIKGQTLALYGDDIYAKEDLATLVSQAKKNAAAWHILVARSDEGHRFGQVVIKEGRVIAIEEEGEQHHGEEGFTHATNTGAYVIDERIFRYKPVRVSSGEYGLPQTLVGARGEIPLIPLFAKRWIPLNTQEDYKKAQEILAKSFLRNSSKKESE